MPKVKTDKISPNNILKHSHHNWALNQAIDKFFQNLILNKIPPNGTAIVNVLAMTIQLYFTHLISFRNKCVNHQ